MLGSPVQNDFVVTSISPENSMYLFVFLGVALHITIGQIKTEKKEVAVGYQGGTIRVANLFYVLYKVVKNIMR
ncbi:hypothetical protein PAECIP111894_01962 [Paenibacillus pseudetheri]|uniref:Uncharacterized protein n=1 Tax=Paenibacillus pseudetheri TaxID=2897682 RepID=A0ABM9BAS7_9BACL|nr:hypothetical protein PAECIP111894_01962 [Paenibacillus pseudetheri]